MFFVLQVSYLASVLRLGVSPEASFNQWAWQLLLRLKLHANAQNPKGAWSVPALTSNPPPELTHSPSMHSVIRAVKAGIPIGCYLSITMTTAGHRFVLFHTLLITDDHMYNIQIKLICEFNSSIIF